MTNHHVGDAAALYALGALDPEELRTIDRHTTRCVPCSRLLGEAEGVVASLNAHAVPLVAAPDELARRIANAGREPVSLDARRPPDVWRWGTLAACFLAAALGFGGSRQVALDRATIANDDVAFRAIAGSHFSHTTFTKIDPNAPTTKVLWGKQPHWLYVIVDAHDCGCSVVARTNAGERVLGAPASRGATSTLFVNDAPGVTSVELRAGSRVLAIAHP